MSAAAKKEKQSIIVRGIAAQIQAMAMPTMDSLRAILLKFGWKLTRDDNKQTNNDSSNS
jgi:hypothetical protein